MPAQFEPDRIMRADVQQLLKKVSVRPDQEFTDQYLRRCLPRLSSGYRTVK
jgi:2-methylcitrate dehydratase